MNETSGFGKEYHVAVTKEGHLPYHVKLKQSHVSVNAWLASLLGSVGGGAASVGLVAAGLDPVLVTVGFSVGVVAAAAQSFQLDDYYLLPVGAEGNASPSAPQGDDGVAPRIVDAPDEYKPKDFWESYCLLPAPRKE